ncbi:MAG: MBOAT family protein [Candidatus Omnitrophica bacterium]|nr:MBOAT family protein [Candidatus Omnitrophota bacterium]
MNLSILAFFKYYNFFANNLSELLYVIFPASQHLISLFALNIILPVGVSFYTFEAISYSVDVYRRLIPPTRHYTDYLLFVIYFPHLIAGPIMRAKDFLPQIIRPRRLSWDQFYEGCNFITWGLFEKIFVADNLAKIVDPVFTQKPPYNGTDVLISLYAFAFQIFCDFDGYSNIARGLGKCMGFEITINFQWPYFSRNPPEFWQRWHISLSSWLRDYLYIPLGGNRNGEWSTYKNLMLTMVLGGLWHGAAWTFVLWGLYHGSILILHRFWTKRINFKIGSFFPPGLLQPLQVVFFFHVTLFGWLLFRSPSVSQVVSMTGALFTSFTANYHTANDLSLLLFYLTPLLLAQGFQYYKKDLILFTRLPWIVQPLFYATLLYGMVIWGANKPETFIYFQF